MTARIETKGNTLSAKQRKLIEALLIHPTMEAACNAVSIGRTTAYRWHKQESFRAALATARDEVFREAMSALKVTTAKATAALDALLDGSTPPAVRRAAAKDVIELSLRRAELEEIEQRLAALEARLLERTP